VQEFVVARLDEGGWRQICQHNLLEDALEACEREVLRTLAPSQPVNRELLLADQELCRGFSPAELEALSARLETVDQPVGTEVVVAGSPAKDMYFLIRGEVGVFLKPNDGPEQLLSRLGPGMSFGELALADRAPRSATIRALEPIRALRLSFQAFDHLTEEGLAPLQAKLMTNLVGVLASRLRSANAEIRSLQ